MVGDGFERESNEIRGKFSKAIDTPAEYEKLKLRAADEDDEMFALAN